MLSKADISSNSVVAAPKNPMAALYLFCEHFGNPQPEWCHSLYKIEVDSIASTNHKAEAEAEELFPIVKFPEEEYPTQGMRCARLGSKLYFLGGTKKKDRDLWYPQDVYSFDFLTGDFKKMEDAPLNAGKPKPCVVFAANGKLYALARIPYCDGIPPSERPLFLSKMNLFECFDPAINKWEVLDNLPPIDVGRDWAKRSVYRGGINWVGCTVMEKHQQVVLIGKVVPFVERPGSVVKLVYHLEQGNWTCDSLEDVKDIPVALSFQEGIDGSWFYGLPRGFLPPVKSKSGFLSKMSEFRLFNFEPVPDDVLNKNGEDDLFDFEFFNDDGSVGMSILDKTKEEACKWFFNQRGLYTSYWYKRLLRHIGNDYFCYISSGMLPGPKTNHFCCRFGYERDWDVYALGITVTLFKEIKDEDEDEDEEKLLFRARILHSQSYVIRTPFINYGDLEECFVVTPEQLQKTLDGKKDKKKKNVELFGSTSG